MKFEEQIEQLEGCVEAFAGAVALLDERLFLEKVTSWTARDIVAHLIGWNRYIVRGGRQILRGELPFYDVDPGPDYSKVNAELVRKYAETDRSKLLQSLTASANELTSYLRSIDPDAWDRDFGVRHDGETVTVKSTVSDLIADYHHHRAQLEEFNASAGKRRMIDSDVAVFFYGLFMDKTLLALKGISPSRATVGYVDGYELRIGRRATLVPAETSRAYGVLMTIRAEDVRVLYSEESVADYVAESVSVVLPDGTLEPAVCYNLPESKLEGTNPQYAKSLLRLAGKLGLPGAYLQQIRRQVAE